jgi:hypothetical protein
VAVGVIADNEAAVSYIGISEHHVACGVAEARNLIGRGCTKGEVVALITALKQAVQIDIMGRDVYFVAKDISRRGDCTENGIDIREISIVDTIIIVSVADPNPL